MSELTIENGWTLAGRIEPDGNALRPPALPDVPGIYCLKFENGRRYYGEASNLQRRIGDYLLYYPTTGIESEFRVNKAIRDSKGAEVLIATGEQFQSKSKRCTVESQLIKQAKSQNISLVNGGSIPESIAFHASEILRLSAKLSAATGDHQHA